MRIRPIRALIIKVIIAAIAEPVSQTTSLPSRPRSHPRIGPPTSSLTSVDMVGLLPRAAAVLSARCSDGAHACNSARRVAIGIIAVGNDVRDAWRDGLLSRFGNNGDIGGAGHTARAGRGRVEPGNADCQDELTGAARRRVGCTRARLRWQPPAQARRACRYSRTLCAPRTTTQP
ncbi:hypothetical protein K525DRAFT_281468 [Schizophyllum commune Loenen D]|nr:hypothetical protein K525DRAFT_281468 [Schizophyllum commune Loenen D]